MQNKSEFVAVGIHHHVVIRRLVARGGGDAGTMTQLRWWHMQVLRRRLSMR